MYRGRKGSSPGRRRSHPARWPLWSPICTVTLRIYDGLQARLAIARAEEAIARGDQVDDACVTLGVVYQKRTEDKDALAAFLRAIEANPRNAGTYRWAAVVYADRGELANEHRVAAHEIEPDYPDAWEFPYKSPYNMRGDRRASTVEQATNGHGIAAHRAA